MSFSFVRSFIEYILSLHSQLCMRLPQLHHQARLCKTGQVHWHTQYCQKNHSLFHLWLWENETVYAIKCYKCEWDVYPEYLLTICGSCCGQHLWLLKKNIVIYFNFLRSKKTMIWWFWMKEPCISACYLRILFFLTR